jgi:hypothetical protein
MQKQLDKLQLDTVPAMAKQISTLETTTIMVQKDIQLNNESVNQLKVDISGLSTSKQVQQIQD